MIPLNRVLRQFGRKSFHNLWHFRDKRNFKNRKQNVCLYKCWVFLIVVIISSIVSIGGTLPVLIPVH